MQRINSCDLLKKHNENDPFLKRLIIGDEKWVVYNNIKRKRSWSKPREPAQTTSKTGIHQKKVLLSVWWDYKGIVYFELLPPNRTINSVVYIEQLMKLNNTVEEKRPELTNRKCCIPSWQCKATHIFDYSAKIIGAWLGCFATSTI